MDLLKVVEALTEDMDPQAKAKAMMVASVVAEFVENLMRGVDQERVGTLVAHAAAGDFLTMLLFRRAMRKAGLERYANIGPALGLGARIAASNFEKGRAYTRQFRAEMEAAGVAVGTPKRKP